MAQKHTLTWVNPDKRVDQSAFAPAEEVGVQIELDGQKVADVAGPATSFDLASVSQFASLTPGVHTAGVAVKDTGGLVSDFGTTSFPVLSSSPPAAPTRVELA